MSKSACLLAKQVSVDAMSRVTPPSIALYPMISLEKSVCLDMT